MRGRHTSVEEARRWAPNAKHAALAVAPVAALLIAVGGGTAGAVLHRSDLAAAGAGSGVLAYGLEQLASRAQRRRLREDRAEMRGRLHDLEATITQLRREVESASAFLLPQPPPSPTTGPLPIVDAFHHAAAPATPRSLPILTANRRGLQSCAPGFPGLEVPASSVPATPADGIEELAGAVAQLAASLPQRERPQARPAVPALPPISPLLPGQRPPATPISGLHLPPVADPSITALEPGPTDPLLDTAGLPVLQPGPSVSVVEHATAGAVGSTGPGSGPGTVTGSVTSTVTGAAGAQVIDLRTVADPSPATAGQPSAATVDALVFSAIAEAEADAFTITMEQPGRAAASLFEPVHRPRPEGLSWVFDDTDRAVAETRAAARAMRPGIPPSPFFTPGAFVGDRADGAEESRGRHSA